MRVKERKRFKEFSSATGANEQEARKLYQGFKGFKCDSISESERIEVWMQTRLPKHLA